MMNLKELKLRIGCFWYVFKSWMYGVLTCKAPKGMEVQKHLITYGIVVDGIQIERHEGTFVEFVKWIVTHESFYSLLQGEEEP